MYGIFSDLSMISGGVSCLNLDLLGHFPAGIDPMTFKSAKDSIEAALLDSELAFQSLNHFPVGMSSTQPLK